MWGVYGRPYSYFLLIILYYIMAKKKQAVEVENTATTEVLETIAAPKQKITVKEPIVENKQWQIKGRTYVLKGDSSPVTFTLASKHYRRNPLMWYDEEKNVNRELRYASNQGSPFVDEQNGFSTLQHIVFKNGTLFVPKSEQSLQKLLSLYHPQLNKTYFELDEVADAKDELADIEQEIAALNIAKDLDISHGEAVLRVEQGSSVSTMTTAEIKRDLLLFAKRQPELFIDLVNDDNVQLRNFGIKAMEAGIIKLSGDQRSFHWAANNKKLMNIPFDENPYSALAAYFKTDEGTEVYKSIEKKIK
jgi:hypothetical protein